MISKKIIFTGGHHNSALVVAKILKKKGYGVYWFGHKHTMKREKSLSLELQEVKKANLPFIEIKTGKFYRTYNPFHLIKIFYGFCQSFCLLLRIKPQLIVSFGGYLSYPVVLAGKLLGIDSIIHEQTSHVGLANRILAPLAKVILLTWSSSKRYFPKHKTKVIGLPLDAGLLKKEKIKPLFLEKLPVVLITGGKQGSHIINKTIEKKLAIFLNSFNLIHQTGGILKTNDFERLVKIKKSLPRKLQKRYLLKKFFFKDEMTKVLKSADFVISRSGAHIVYELATIGKPAILIPLPWAYNNEQLANARILEKKGAAVIIPQKELTSVVLWQKTNDLFKHLNEFSKKALELKKIVKKDAALQMLKIIEEIV